MIISPLYLLDKQNIDSNHALIEIKKEYGIALKVIGIKDAKAITKQYASSEQTRKVPKELKTTHTHLKLKGFTKSPLSKSALSGNEFTVTLYKPRCTDLSDFIPYIENIGNFYGLQRFGSERLVTHLVGKQILKRNFRAAVDLLLSYTTEYDSKFSQEIRQKSIDPANYSTLIRQLPRGMDIEYGLMSALVAGKDAISALRTVPINIRRLFVQAYQAFLFNKCLSKAILSDENLLLCKTGDLCFDLEDSLIFGRVRKYDPVQDVGGKVVPAIRLCGFTFQPGKGRFDIITKEILKEENIHPSEFIIKEMQELSAQGGFRQAPLWCQDFSYTSQANPKLNFKLPKGSYATTLLRELIKPTDPIASGF